MDIKISDDEVNYLSEQAKKDFADSVKGYADDLIVEASRLETTSRVGDGKPEITGSMIKDATLYLKKYATQKSTKSWGYILIQILSTVSTLFTGGLFNIDKFQKDSAHLIIFLIILTIAIISNTAVIILGRNK